MAPFFPISASSFIWSHLGVKLPVGTKSFGGKTVIVTGANTGLGLEAARHIARMGAEKTILAVRNEEKGHAAAASIRESTGCSKDALEVWEVELGSYDSIKAFGDRVNMLPRLDVVIENAGVFYYDFVKIEEDEIDVRINVLATMFMALLVLPKLRQTAETHETDVVLTFVGSWMHWATDFPERNAENSLVALSTEPGSSRNERYPTTKLISLLAFRRLHAALTRPKKGRLIMSYTNPGAVFTEITRNVSGSMFRLMVNIQGKVFMRSAEEGARTLVHAAEGGHDTDGKYLDNCRSDRTFAVSPWVTSEEGEKAADKVWREILERLETVQPGISHNI